MVTAFQAGLIFVGGEQLSAGEVAVVADQWEAAVGGGVGGDLGGVDVPGGGEPGFGDLPVAGGGPGGAAVFLPVGFLGGLGDDGADPAGRAGLGEEPAGFGFGGGAAFELAFGPGQAGGERVDRGGGGLDACLAGGRVVAVLVGGVHPFDPVALGGGQRAGEGGVDAVGVAGAPAGQPQRLTPGGEVAAGHPGAEPGVLGPAAGQHGDEPAALGVDVAHRLAGGQLAVGDVEKVRAPGQRG